MTSKERMRLAMTGGKPDRIPVMCQLALGHIYKNCDMGPLEYWFSSKGLAEGFIQMADRYGFDGILINIPGVDPAMMSRAKSTEKSGSGHVVTWKDGRRTYFPPDDDPRPVSSESSPIFGTSVSIDDFDIGSVRLAESESQLPDYFFGIIDEVMSRKGGELSIHGEVGTAFEYFLNLMGGYARGLMALVDNPAKCIDVMAAINREVIVKAKAQCARGVDAMKLSSPIAGSSFISRGMYEKFVLPFEREVIRSVKEKYDIPCYIHTCGKIGDRLDLLVNTGTDGIECLDPAPLGDVKLEEAVDTVGGNVFLKGNLDSVNELYGHTPQEVIEIARKRIETGMRSPKGYILSSACSVSPVTLPQNIMALREAAETYGRL